MVVMCVAPSEWTWSESSMPVDTGEYQTTLAFEFAFTDAIDWMKSE
jgi:hypothetical protein